MKKTIWIVSLIIAGFSSAEAKTVDRIVAQVNNEIITLSELNREMFVIRQGLSEKYTGEQLEQAVQKAEQEALDGIIRQKLMLQKAMELGFNANTDSRVSAEIQQIIQERNLKDMEGLEKALEKQNMTMKDLRDQLRDRMIVEDLISEFVRSRITVLPEEIDKFYKDHIEEFTTPEEVSLSEIMIRSKGNDTEAERKANDIYSRLKKGEKFAELASQYSQGITASKGGSTGSYVLSTLKPETVQALADLKEGDISKVQKLADGYIIYHIDSRKLAVSASLDQVKDRIKNQLYYNKYNPELQRYLTQLWDEAYIQKY